MPAKVPGASRRPLLFALDPGFATMGVAILDARGAILEADTFVTEPADKPKNPGATFAAADRRKRAALAWRWLTRMRIFAEQDGAIVAFVAEANSGSRGFGVALALGVGATLIGAFGEELHRVDAERANDDRIFPTDPILVAPEEWRAPLMADFWAPVPAPRKRAGESEERTRRRMKVRRENRAEQDRHLYAKIGDSLADPDDDSPNVRTFVARRLKTWARRPSSIVHALDAVGLGRFALEHVPAVRAAMGPPRGVPIDFAPHEHPARYGAS